MTQIETNQTGTKLSDAVLGTTGQETLEAAGQSMKSLKDNIAQVGSNVARLAGLGASLVQIGFSRKEQIQEYALSKFQETAEAVNQRLEGAKGAVEKKVGEVTASIQSAVATGVEQEREKREAFIDRAKGKIGETIAYVQAEVQLPIDLAKKGLVNKTVELQEQLGIPGVATTVKSIENLAISQEDKALLLTKYQTELSAITTSIAERRDGLHMMNKEGAVTRHEYIEQRHQIQSDFITGFTKLQADALQVGEEVAIKTEQERHKHSSTQRLTKTQLKNLGEAVEYTGKSHAELIEKAWSKARAEDTFDVPAWAQKAGNYSATAR